MNIAVKQRPTLRLFLLAAAVVSAAALGFGAGAADPRLDEADAALQKAGALLAASQSGNLTPQAQHRFDKAVARAIADVQDAREEIADAKAAADEGAAP